MAALTTHTTTQEWGLFHVVPAQLDPSPQLAFPYVKSGVKYLEIFGEGNKQKQCKTVTLEKCHHHSVIIELDRFGQFYIY